MPESVIKLIESDAKQILWSTEPSLRTNEEGTEKKSRRYIHERTSYLPIKKGGGGIMHWESHCEAFYAQWMIRYLPPRKAPWKEIADLWLCGGTLGRGVIVSNTDLSDTLNAVPDTAPYLQRCLKSYIVIELEIRQNIKTADHQLPEARAEIWREEIGVIHFYDLAHQGTAARSTAPMNPLQGLERSPRDQCIRVAISILHEGRKQS